MCPQTANSGQAEEIAAAGAAGAPAARMSEMIAALRMQELRTLAMLFDNLRDELRTGRAGTAATRFVRARRKAVAGREERLDRYVISRPRSTRVTSQTEVLLLDGTGSLSLNRALFGEDVEEHRTAVQRQGATVQITTPTNSKNRLLAGPQAARNRKTMGRLIENLDTMLGGSLLVGCTKELRRKLIDEGAVDEGRSMHFNAERGLNSAEGAAGVLVVGREQASVQALEDLARGLALTAPEPFVSVLDELENGFLPIFRRRRRMRDGSEAWADVSGDPDPNAQALLEQMREAGVVQMADRVRAVWPDRLIVIATDVPVDLDVDLLVTQGELMAAASAGAVVAREVRERGWSLRAEPAGRPAGRIRRTTTDSLIRLLGFALIGIRGGRAEGEDRGAGRLR